MHAARSLVRHIPLASACQASEQPALLNCDLESKKRLVKKNVVRQRTQRNLTWTLKVASNCFKLTWCFAVVFFASYDTPQQGDTAALCLDGIAKLLLPCVGCCGKQHVNTHQQVQVCSLHAVPSSGIVPTSVHQEGGRVERGRVQQGVISQGTAEGCRHSLTWKSVLIRLRHFFSGEQYQVQHILLPEF